MRISAVLYIVDGQIHALASQHSSHRATNIRTGISIVMKCVPPFDATLLNPFGCIHKFVSIHCVTSCNGGSGACCGSAWKDWEFKGLASLELVWQLWLVLLLFSGNGA